MPAAISVVIPTLNAASELPETANALLCGIGDGLIRELVVSDGGSEDETLTIARDLGAVIVTGEAGRGGQIARGVAAAKGSWVLILHADTHLSDNWPDVARRHIGEHGGKAGWFRLRFRATGLAPRIVEAGASLRSRLLALPYGDQGLLVQKTLLDAVGGVPELALMEDVALARRLKQHLRMLEADALTSADRYVRDGWIARPLRNLVTLTRYGLGVDPAWLAKSYQPLGKPD